MNIKELIDHYYQSGIIGVLEYIGILDPENINPRITAYNIINAGYKIAKANKSPSLNIFPEIALGLSRHESIYRMAGLFEFEIDNVDLALEYLIYLYYFYKENETAPHPQYLLLEKKIARSWGRDISLEEFIKNHKYIYYRHLIQFNIKEFSETINIEDISKQRSFFTRLYRKYDENTVLAAIEYDVRFNDRDKALLILRAAQIINEIADDSFDIAKNFADCALTKDQSTNVIREAYKTYLKSDKPNNVFLKSALRVNSQARNQHQHLDLLYQHVDKNYRSKYFNAKLSELQELANKKDYKRLAERLFNLYYGKKDVDSLINYILFDIRMAFDLDTKAIQIILINVGKYSNLENKKDDELAFCKKAMQLEKNPMSVKALFWSYQRCGYISKSKNLLNWLCQYAEAKSDKKLLNYVESKSRSYAFLTEDSLQAMLNEASNFVNVDYVAEPNKIAYVLHNSLPYASGGYATRGHGLASAINNRGMDVVVITRPGFPLDTKKELVADDIALEEVIDGVTYKRIIRPERHKTATYDYILQAVQKLYEAFLEVKPSLVVGASNHLTAMPALLAARRLGIPFIYEVRGFWEVTRESREPEFAQSEWYALIVLFEAFTAKNAAHVFTLTTPMKEELVKRGTPENKVDILPNSCDPAKFEPKPRSEALAIRLNIPATVPVIGYIGTFVQYEGLEHLAEACGILKQRGIEFRLMIVGNENTAGDDKGPITQHILDVAKDFDFEDWLIMPGRIPHEEVEEYYSLVDIAPFPRKPQPVTEMVSPMKPLEAAAMKKAIVVSSVRALTDMITDGKNGLVFEKGNIEDFADKLYQLVKDDELRAQLGERARQWVEEERTWERTSSKFIEIFEHL